jgi:hypothetical protein
MKTEGVSVELRERSVDEQYENSDAMALPDPRKVCSPPPRKVSGKIDENLV